MSLVNKYFSNSVNFYLIIVILKLKIKQANE